MKRNGRLAALNLALLLAIMAILPMPARAAEGVVLTDEDLWREHEKEDRLLGSEEVTLLAEGTLITVGNTMFFSNQDCSGDGWYYSAADEELVLDGYNGGGIKASAGLDIYVVSDSTIIATTPSLKTIGPDGIYVEGIDGLDIYTEAGAELTVQGARGKFIGGDGLYAYDIWLMGQGSVRVTGGYGASYGGLAIYAYNRGYLLMDGSYTGGNSVLRGRHALYGGDGVYYSISGDSTFKGGHGAKTSSGDDDGCGWLLPDEGTIYVGLADVVVEGGSEQQYSIGAQSDYCSLRMSRHMMKEEISDSKTHFHPKSYTLTVDGSGGLHDGSVEKDEITKQYPYTVELGEYDFQKPGHRLYGYLDEEGVYYAPTAEVQPDQDMTVTAQWAPADEDTVLLVGGEGTIAGEAYQTYEAGETILLPQAHNTDDRALAGWSTEPYEEVSRDSDWYAADAEWFAAGTEVSFAEGTNLYARWYDNDNGVLVRYHANGGLFSDGSNLKVQNDIATGTDLTVYVCEDLPEIARSGYTLEGWFTEDGIEYDLGDVVKFQRGGEFQTRDLYARWTPDKVYESEASETGKMDLIPIPEEDSFEVKFDLTEIAESVAASQPVTAEVVCALYDDAGKMVGLTVKTITLDPDSPTGSLMVDHIDAVLCNLFLLSEQKAPLGQQIVCDMSGE